MKRFLLTGHVNHGKSTIGGQILYQCNAYDKREVQKIFEQAEQEKMYSFRWARLLDINSEERDKGVTMECNEIEFTYQNIKYKLIDTPGHKLYIRNLIDAIYRNSSDATAEKSNVVGVLVISAIANELESAMTSGQIKEDILLLRAIGIDSIIVAINKLDKVGWLSDAFESTKILISPMLKLAKYKQILFAACSGLEGKGIIDCNPNFSHIPTLISSIEKLSINTSVSTVNSEQIKILETLTITANIFILNCNIFSPGYCGIIHMNNGEFSFTVDKITITGGKNKPFIKTGERGIVVLTLNEKVSAKTKDRIVLRNGDETVGYGIIIE